MFYAWLEAQRALMRSVDAWAALARCAAGVPAMPDPLLAPLVAPGCDWVYRLYKAAPEPPPFGIDAVEIDGRRVPVAEEVVDTVPFCTLRRFRRLLDDESRAAALPAVLLCTPLAGHHAVMLRETAETLLTDADVYVTDWADARTVPLSAGRFGLDDYVLTLARFMQRLVADGLHVVAVCQATAPSVAAAARVVEDGGMPPRSLTLMGGPIDTRLNPTVVDRLAATHSLAWFRSAVIDTVPAGHAGAGRRVYPGYIQHAAIVAAHPHRQFALESRYWTCRLAGRPDATAASLRALNEYAAVLDMSEDYFLETLEVVFQQQRLARGTWVVDGRLIRPQLLANTALCTVEGDRDDITGAGQTHAAHDVCTAVPAAWRARLTVEDCDHYDLFTGPRWHERIHPALVRFWREIAACSTAPVATASVPTSRRPRPHPDAHASNT